MIPNTITSGFIFEYFIGFLACIGIIIIFLQKNKLDIFEEIDTLKIHRFIKKVGGNSLSHLILLKDKHLYWAQKGKVLIAYRKVGKMFFVLGDPVGDERSIGPALREFINYCDRLGYSPVFYQVSSNLLEYYKKEDYQSIKIGEEAKVSLNEFTLKGKQGAKLRTRKNKFVRNGYQFEVLQPPHSNMITSEISNVSNSWLGDRKEKSFSVASFSKEYVSHFPIAVLRDIDDNIIAFASLASNYQDENSSITIDLMRNIGDSPHGTMDVLFIYIFEWAQQQGYDFCSLGMSPLSNVGVSNDSTIAEKFGRFVYLKGNLFYKFKGLKEFKAKFAHVWEPKYIVFNKRPLLICLRLIKIIHFRPENRGKRMVLNDLKKMVVNHTIKYK